MDRCLITLELLDKKQPQPGYSSRGIKYLTGNMTTSMELPFTRDEFVTELPGLQQGLSISGYQPKLSLAIQNKQFHVVDQMGSYILKPSPEAYPYLAENEHATMMVMKKLKFSVPEFGLVAFKKVDNADPTELAFIIKRFDRDMKTGEKIHQEQLDGAMAIDDKYGHRDGKQQISYESACRFLIEQVDSSLPFKRDLFLRVIYAYLLGNNDFHLRNFGILEPQVASNSLAPVYDFVSTAPYSSTFNSCYLALPLLTREENDRVLAPGFDTQFGQYIGYDFMAFGKGIGLNERYILKLFAEIQKQADVVRDTYQISFMPPQHIEAVLKCFNTRLKLIEVVDLDR